MLDHNKNQTTKFFILFFIVLIAVFTVSYFAYSTSKETIRSTLAKASSQAVSQAMDRMDVELEQIRKAVDQLNYSPDLRFIIKNVNHNFANQSNNTINTKIRQILETSKSTNKNIHIIRLLNINNIGVNIKNGTTDDNTNISTLSSKLFIPIDQNKPIFKHSLMDIKQYTWLPTSINGWMKSNELDNKVIRDYTGPEFALLSPFTNMKSISGDEYVFDAEIGIHFFQAIYDRIKLENGTSFYLMDQNGMVVYSSNALLTSKSYSIPLEHQNGDSIQFVNKNNTDFVLIKQQSSITNWILYTYIPTSDLFKNVNQTLWMNICMFTLLIIIFIISFILFRRFQQMNDSLVHTSTELRVNNEQLARQSEELIKLNALKDQILSNTSHELRTPLNGIIGIAESLIDGVGGKLNEVVNKNLRIIIASGLRLNTLVNDILDFNKMKNKKLELRIRPVDVSTVAEMTVALLKSLIGKKPVEIINHISKSNPPAVLADENRLQQILHNILSNSIKFTDAGMIEMFSAIQGNHLSISIKDTGIGIPSDRLDDIFKSFEQIEGSLERSYGGTGLGLAVTKQLIELQKGNIQVESTLGKGTTFTFSLPIAFQDDMVESSITNEHQQSAYEHALLVDWDVDPVFLGQSSTYDSTILLVDDEAINLNVLVNHLSQFNYRLFTANNGVEALAMIKKGLQPDLILLDVMMPKMSGYDVTKEVRKQFTQHVLPIILLSAKNTNEDIVKGFMAGANDYVTKPFSKQELLARIDMQLKVGHVSKQFLKQT